MEVIRVVVVSSLPAVRAGLRAMLAAAGGEELQVVADAGSLLMLEAYTSLPDILLVSGEAFSAPSVSRLLSRSGPEDGADGELAVMALTEDSRLARDLEKLPLRAWGLLRPDTTADELVAGLHALAQGLWVADSSLARGGLAGLLSTGEDQEYSGEPLTGRESQVLQLLAQGLANKQIAAALGISEHTVKFHVSSIYTRLGVTNRAEAVRRGIQLGWVTL